MVEFSPRKCEARGFISCSENNNNNKKSLGEERVQGYVCVCACECAHVHMCTSTGEGQGRKMVLNKTGSSLQSIQARCEFLGSPSNLDPGTNSVSQRFTPIAHAPLGLHRHRGLAPWQTWHLGHRSLRHQDDFLS